MNTKAAFLTLSMFLSTIIFSIAQKKAEDPGRETVVYTLFYNVVPDRFQFPIIGFVNIAQGSHRGLQLGFVNTTMQDFTGLQVGFVNTTLGNSLGAKVGFVNTTRHDAEGLRVGYVNTTVGNSTGAMFGFVNTVAENKEGLQLGFVNLARKEMSGAQIGFINVADTIPNGAPIGFLSFVRKGGYRALETSVNELYPFNLAFKMGVPRFYSFLQGSYNNSYSEPYAFGFGIGSLIPLGGNFYFNPELGNISPLADFNNNVTSLATNIRYSLSPRIQLAVGLSAVWLNHGVDRNIYDPPFFAWMNREIDSRNRLLGGARLAVSYNFTELWFK
jgi:hypothetical protein